MKKVLFFVFAAIALVACGGEKNPTGKVESIAIAPTSLELTLGESKRLSLKVTPADAEKPTVVWASSDESIATVSSKGTVTTFNYGNATITATANVDGKELKAECALSVVNELDALKFDRVALWTLDQDNPYTIDYWGAKYDENNNIVTDPETGDTLRELRTDSVYLASFMMLSDQLYLDGDGYIRGAKDSYALSMPTAFTFDSQYFYCLGLYSVVEDCNIWYREKGDSVIGKPWLSNIQYGELDEQTYIDFYVAALTEQEPNIDEYPYFRDRDAYFVKFYFSTDEDGESSTSAREAGWLYDEGMVQIGNGDNLASLSVPYYNLSAKFMTNLGFYGLATEPAIDEETGEPAVDEEGEPLYNFSTDEEGNCYMAEIVEKQLVFGEISYEAPSRQAVGRKALEVKMAVDRILDAPIRIKYEDFNFIAK